MRIVLDTTVLVRAFTSPGGPASALLLDLIAGPHTLLLSNAILHEVSRVLRYPRLQASHGATETSVYEYAAYLSAACEAVPLDQLMTVPIRDVNDIAVVCTAVIGRADIICTNDSDFYDEVMTNFLRPRQILVMDDVDLIRRLRA